MREIRIRSIDSELSKAYRAHAVLLGRIETLQAERRQLLEEGDRVCESQAGSLISPTES